MQQRMTTDSNSSLENKVLDKIIKNMMSVVTSAKTEVFQISENSRSEFYSLSKELIDVRDLVKKCISIGERLEYKARLARNRLSEVSSNFESFTEEQIREAYEIANELQTKYTVNVQTEKQLRQRRDDIERRLLGLNKTIERAENLISQITVVMNYLTTDLQQINVLLEDSNLKQAFGLKVMEAQEEERKRLAREIHDGPAQMMANVMLRSDLIEKTFNENGKDAAIQEVKDLKKMVRSALFEVRRIIYDLRPMALDDLGIVPTLKKYLQTTEEYHSNFQITFKNLKEERRLESKYEVAIFRLIQEAVQNAIKHSNGSQIQVKLLIDKGKLTATIKDNGSGFDPKDVKEESFGLIGMRERIELLNGKLDIRSKKGDGTVISINFPLKE